MPVRTQRSVKTSIKPRTKPKLKSSARRTANKVSASAKRVASKLSRATKSKRKSVVVPVIEPPRPGAARAKPARPVGHAPLRTRRSASPALSLSGGGVAVPRRAR